MGTTPLGSPKVKSGYIPAGGTLWPVTPAYILTFLLYHPAPTIVIWKSIHSVNSINHFANHASTKHFLHVSICCVDEKNVSLTELEAGYTCIWLLVRIWVNDQLSDGSLVHTFRLQQFDFNTSSTVTHPTSV